MIVDDEPRNLTVLEAILDDPAYRLIRAVSAQEALQALLNDEFALLILDIRMPEVSGFDLARMIRERKKTANVPIIFLTAHYGDHQHVIEGYGAGAVDYLSKPVDSAVLRSKVSIFAELYRKRQDVERVNSALQAEVRSRRRAEKQLRELNDTLEQQTASLNSSNQCIQELLKEVNHRSKNIMHVVQAIARQSAIENPDEFLMRFSDRIQTLAASHELLVKSQWRGVEISDLIRVQLGHFDELLDRRIMTHGPPFRLSVTAAQALGMIVHELATNAAKYGALSNDSGQVEVRWHANHVFVMSWAERGGPPVTAPSRRGFGSTVVKTMAESSLQGNVDLDFTPAGLRWRVTCPSTSVREESGYPPADGRQAARVVP